MVAVFCSSAPCIVSDTDTATVRSPLRHRPFRPILTKRPLLLQDRCSLQLINPLTAGEIEPTARCASRRPRNKKRPISVSGAGSRLRCLPRQGSASRSPTEVVSLPRNKPSPWGSVELLRVPGRAWSLVGSLSPVAWLLVNFDWSQMRKVNQFSIRSFASRV